RLLGLQGFSALRAQRYRAELEKLLVHRMTTMQRWSMGIMGIYMLVAFEIMGMALAVKSEQLNLPMTPESLWTFAISLMLLGLVFGGWFLRIALQGGFSRRLGDLMGVAIVLLLGGSATSLFYSSALNAEDAISR